jgi:hypothetical protein
MPKLANKASVIYKLARRADIELSRQTADILTVLLLKKEALRRRLREPAFCQELVDYGVIGLMTLAAGALASLVTTFIIIK